MFCVTKDGHKAHPPVVVSSVPLGPQYAGLPGTAVCFPLWTHSPDSAGRPCSVQSAFLARSAFGLLKIEGREKYCCYLKKNIYLVILPNMQNYIIKSQLVFKESIREAYFKSKLWWISRTYLLKVQKVNIYKLPHFIFFHFSEKFEIWLIEDFRTPVLWMRCSESSEICLSSALTMPILSLFNSNTY